MLVSSRPEPEWDDTEREAMLGLQRYRDRERCPRCGGPAWICQASEAEHEWRAAVPVRCHITTAIQRAQKAYRDLPHQPHEDALVWTATPAFDG